MKIEIRRAVSADVEKLEPMIAESVRTLSVGYYSCEQIERSVRTVFGVDLQLVEDGTYFVAEAERRIVGCGGWSKRRKLIVSRSEQPTTAALLDPASEPAKIRAFFVHPAAARKGVGRAILSLCEREAASYGFRSAEMLATLPGVGLYEACGYGPLIDQSVPVGDGIELPCVVMRKDLA